MAASFELAGMRVTVVRKDIRNLHLSVRPPTGDVRVAAPRWMRLETIRLFAAGKLGWIRRQQRKLREQVREPRREYLERESHFVWGRRYLLHVVEHDAPPMLELAPRRLLLQVRPGTSVERREAIVEHWYRARVREVASELLAKWEPRVGRKAADLRVQRMKTRWGGCNVAAGRIRLNTELARKPAECLEYVLLHELVHLHERAHNERFVALMTRLMPDWRERRARLNALPLREECPAR